MSTPEAERPPHVINHHDLLRLSGAAGFAWWPAEFDGWKRGADSAKTWDEVLTRCPNVAEWATIATRGHGSPWFPATFVPAVQALKLTSDYLGKIGSSVKCVTGRPCEVIQHTGDGRMTSWGTCSRPAADPITLVSGGARMSAKVPGCRMHLAAKARQDANDAARRAEWDERDRKRDEQRAMDKASAEWAQRLRDEFGVHADAAHSREHLRVLVEPERLYRQLTELLVELRALELDGDLWPFHPGEVSGR